MVFFGEPMRVKIRGKFWTLVYRPQSKMPSDENGPLLGLCESPDSKRKKILINSSLRDETELRILLHESAHAGLWHLDESVVDELSTDLARMLWNLGYRKVK